MCRAFSQVGGALLTGRQQHYFRLPVATRHVSALVLVLVAYFFAEAPLFAASLYWDTNGATAGAGTVVTGTWSTAGGSWTTSGSNGTAATFATTTTLSDDLFFSAGSDATGASTITISGTQAARSVTLLNGTITLSGAASPSLTLGDGGLTMASSLGGALTLNSSLTSVLLGASQTWTNNSNFGLSSSSATVIAGTASSGNTFTLTIGGSGSTTLAGAIGNDSGGGNVALTKSGSGTLTLSGANGYKERSAMLKIAPLRKKRYPARGARKKAISHQFHSTMTTCCMTSSASSRPESIERTNTCNASSCSA